MGEEDIRTIAARARETHVHRGSEFIGHVEPIDSVDGAEAVVEDIASEHPDATHVVPAYRVREQGLLHEYSSDDGEPTGSAGKPTLSVLERQGLENCVAVVVRYYGGTNLGVGGLVRAYSGVVAAAIENAGIVEHVPTVALEIDIDYADSGTIESILESEGVEYEATYEESVRYQLTVSSEIVAALIDRIRSATSDRATIRE